MGLESFYIPSREYEERTNDLLMTFYWILKEKDGKNEFHLASKDEAEMTMKEIFHSPVVNITDDEIFDNLQRGIKMDWLRIKVDDVKNPNIEIEAEPNNTGRERKAFFLYKDKEMWRVKVIVQNEKGECL